MANERRVRNDSVFGTLSASIISTDTTINSAGLANLEAVDATEHAVVVLDPRRTAGAPEIVYVTAHTASATSATVTRGQEGTVARSHASAVAWEHAPTARDFVGLSRLVLRRAAVQSIPDATVTDVSWDTEDADTDGYIAVPSTTITIPALLGGVYSITASLALAAAPTGRFFIDLIAGGISRRSPVPAATEADSEISVVVLLNAAATVVLQVFQDHSGAQNATARLEMFRLSP